MSSVTSPSSSSVTLQDSGVNPMLNGEGKSHQFDISDNKDVGDAVPSPPILGTLSRMIIIGAFTGFAAMGNIVSGFMVFTYYYRWGLSLTWALNGGLISYTTGKIVEGVASCLSDKRDPSLWLGRRKPFLITGHVTKMVGALFLSIKPGSHSSVIKAWYVIFLTVYAVGNNIADTPWDTLLVESSKDNAEYSKLKSIPIPIFGAIFGIIGLIVLQISPFITALIFSLGGGLALYFVVTRLPNDVIHESEKSPSLIPSLRMAWRTQEFRTVLASRILIFTSENIFGIAIGYLLLLGFGIEDLSRYSRILLTGIIIGTVIGVILMIICNYVIQVVDKFRVFCMNVLVLSVASMFLFLTSMSESFLTGFIAFLVIIACLDLPNRLLLSLFLRDVITYDKFVTHQNRENMYLMAISLPSDIISTLLASVALFGIFFTGYEEFSDVDDDSVDANYGYTTATLWYLRGVMSLIFFCVIGAYLVFRKYALTSSITDAMQEAIVKRNNENKNISSNVNLLVVNNELSETDIDLLLHLSVYECAYLSQECSEKKSVGESSRPRIDNIIYRIQAALLAASLSALMALVALVFDVMGKQRYSQILITYCAFITFYLVYEYLRYFAAKSIRMLGPGVYASKCDLICQDAANYHNDLRTVLKNANISGATIRPMGQEQDAAARDSGVVSVLNEMITPSRSTSLIQPIYVPNAEPINHLAGYEIVIASFVLVILLCALILAFDV